MMMKLRCISHLLFSYLALLLVSSFLAACQPAKIDLHFETIAQDEGAGHAARDISTEPSLLVLTTVPDKQTLEHFSAVTAYDALANLDYDHYAVVAVFAGWKPTTRYKVEVKQISRTGNTVTVQAELGEPGTDEPAADLATSPYHVIKLANPGITGETLIFNLDVGGATIATTSVTLP
jgi:hypothetical protein